MVCPLRSVKRQIEIAGGQQVQKALAAKDGARDPRRGFGAGEKGEMASKTRRMARVEGLGGGVGPPEQQ